MNRIENVKNHISQNLPDINILKTISDSVFPAGFGDIDFDKNTISERYDNLEDHSDDSLFQQIDGPVKNGVSKKEAYIEMVQADSRGINYLKLSELIEKYGTCGDYSNIILPSIIDIPSAQFNSGSKMLIPGQDKSFIGHVVILSHPEDCYDIAKRHVKKQPNFTPLLMDSIISTTDNDNWRKQRDHFTQAFLPNASLKKVFYKTTDRAKLCVKKLQTEIDKNENVNMCDFLLHEANAQLNITMFGNDKMYTEENNKIIRDTFKGKTEKGTLRRYMDNLVKNLADSINVNFDPAYNDLLFNKDKIINGPLGRAMADQEADEITKWGNGLIFSFAGHDTTGHSMAFFCYEMAKRPDYQIRLQDEIDTFFLLNGDRDIKYEDLKHFKFLSRCWTEILRLWPAIPNGTFRELQYDDYITGSNGEDIKLPKGTYVQITNWVKHRSKLLWGNDVNIFNPDREFHDNELWNNQDFAAYNPYSYRFSPFTYPPRDCIGKNFAQMEARVILIYLFSKFTFKLDKCFDNFDHSKYYGINRGTLSPIDPGKIIKRNGFETFERGMPLIPVKRFINSKL
tara:strand:- start:2060 stop:3763 length:1704 start_codon:yes stop_codon:yes gene_type:complete